MESAARPHRRHSHAGSCPRRWPAALERKPPPPPAFGGSVRVLIGRFDPYARADDGQLWRAVLPQASVEFVDAGHFPHLELPVEIWMPAG